MYTSGTTGEPKGVILTNGAIVAQVLSIDRMLLLTDKVVNNQITNYVFLKLNDSVSFLFSIFL
jgi:long-chain acyl-CoA synthetase